jgi:PAS domain S-box-containing protein
MPAADLPQFLTQVGILVQLGVTILLAGLVVILWSGSRPRQYFGLWTLAWAALAVALVAVAVRHALVPGLGPDLVMRSGPVRTGLHVAYQVAKLLFVVLVGLGVYSYARRPLRPRVTAFVAAAAAGVGVLTGALAPDLNQVVQLQAVVATPGFAASTWLLATARDRRGVGVRVLLVTLLVLTALWALYSLGFLNPIEVDRADGAGTRFLAFLMSRNSFIDAGTLFVLGLGMVVTMVEHSHAESDAQRRRQLEQVEQSEGRLAEILRAAHEGIVTLDSTRRVTTLNPAAEIVLHLPAARAVGEPFDRFLQGDQREALWQDLASGTRRSEAHPPTALRREVIGLRADGEPFPMELAVSSLGEPAGRGFVIVLRDLTEPLKAQEERERLQQQVAQSARLEAVGRMVSGVAHELNNPLTAIIAFSQDLLLETRSEADREALTVIAEQANRCRVIVGDLLIFARSRREERRRVAPAELLQRVVRVFERDIVRSGVRLEVDIAPRLPSTDLDPVGIEQVLINLLTNAFQATPAGGRVTMRARARGDRLELVVEDTGTGIPVEMLPRVFEPFFTTKDPGRGTGLGLSVSHTIVTQHGGSLEVENRRETASGARFIVRLPFVDRRASSRAHGPATEGTAPVPTGERDGPRRVLVVDDEDAIRSAMRRALERRGWEVDEAEDGKEALLRLEVGGRPQAYDAIVTDLRMPGVSGIELYETLLERYPDLAARVVVITGDTASPSAAEFLRRANRPHLQKPFEMQALAGVLDRLVACPTDTAT